MINFGSCSLIVKGLPHPLDPRLPFCVEVFEDGYTSKYQLLDQIETKTNYTSTKCSFFCCHDLFESQLLLLLRCMRRKLFKSLQKVASLLVLTQLLECNDALKRAAMMTA